MQSTDTLKMALAIPYGIITNILLRLGSKAFLELGLTFKMKKDLENLQLTLDTIQANLLDAEEKQESSHAVKAWISRLQEVVYDADDLLDEVTTEDLRCRQQLSVRAATVRQICDFFSSSNQAVFRFRISRRIKGIRNKLAGIAADMSTLNFNKKIVAHLGAAASHHRQTDSLVPTSGLIGREKDTEEVVKLLLRSDNQEDNVSIVAIVGIGGLGKTALAKLIYNETGVEEYFNKKIWVCVSEDFEVNDLIKKILRSVTNKEVENFDLDQLQARLQYLLRDKKYLLVLDDMWNESSIKWDDFSPYLKMGSRGSKVLVTTRSMKVASAMRSGSTFVTCYELKGLNEDESWELFEQVGLREQNKFDPQLNKMAGEVVRRCRGVPLAIKTLGSLVRENTEEQFWSMLSNENNDIWRSFENEDGIFPVLNLSYKHLPIELRQCFSVCSIFPKDSELSKDKLIQIWQAQGYLASPSGHEEQLQYTGGRYFNDLLSRSFFLEEKEEEEEGDISCKMHHLIHDLAKLTAGSGLCVVKDEKQALPRAPHHVLLECKPSVGFLKKLSEWKGIRSIVFGAELEEESVLNTDFSRFKSLRMLDLKYVGIKVLPSSIGELGHLRYLDLTGNHGMELLPDSVTHLHKLQTLILCQCKGLKRLPRDIQKLINLQYLMIKNCNALVCLPRGLGELTSLRRLQRFILTRQTLATPASLNCCARLNDLKDLNKLGGKLQIENLDMMRNKELESEETFLKEKNYLRSLQLDWVKNTNSESEFAKDERLLDNMEPHSSLKYLEVKWYSGVRFSSWLSSLRNLVKITLSQCKNCQHLPALNQLSFLKSLSLIDLHVLQHVSDRSIEEDYSSFFSTSMSNPMFFRSLEELTLLSCDRLKGWWRNHEIPPTTNQLPWFPCLTELVIQNCPQLISMPLFPSLKRRLFINRTSGRPFQQTIEMEMMNNAVTSASTSTLISVL